MTYLTSHFELPTPFGFAERVVPPSIAGTTAPSALPRNPMDNYSGGQGDGRFSSNFLRRRRTRASSHPLNSANGGTPGYQNDGIPILHGNPYGPAVTNGQPNCQAGQTGYALGEALIPGQAQGQPDVRRPERRQGRRHAAARQDRPLPRAGRDPRLRDPREPAG